MEGKLASDHPTFVRASSARCGDGKLLFVGELRTCNLEVTLIAGICLGNYCENKLPSGIYNRKKPHLGCFYYIVPSCVTFPLMQT